MPCCLSGGVASLRAELHSALSERLSQGPDDAASDREGDFDHEEDEEGGSWKAWALGAAVAAVAVGGAVYFRQRRAARM